MTTEIDSKTLMAKELAEIIRSEYKRRMDVAVSHVAAIIIKATRDSVNDGSRIFEIDKELRMVVPIKDLTFPDNMNTPAVFTAVGKLLHVEGEFHIYYENNRDGDRFIISVENI